MADKSFGVKELNLLNASGTPTVTSPNNLNLNANTVAISTSATVGNNLTVSGQINIGSNIKIGNAGVVTATSFVGSGANLTGISAGISTDPSNVQATWKLGGGSGSGFTFTGPGQDGSEGNPDIYLVRGQRYLFDNTTLAGNHPFEFRNEANNADYTDGVSGAQNGLQYINVQHDAPAALKYRCTIHTNSMLGNIYIVGQHLANGANNRVLTATSAYGINAESNMTFDGDDLTISHTGLAVNIFESTDNHSRLRIKSSDASLTQLEFADQSDADAGEIRYDHANDRMTFHVGNNDEKFRIADSGQFGIGGSNYGTAGQVITSQGASSAPQWASPVVAGSILQTVYGTTTNEIVVTSSSFQNFTALNTSITRMSSNSHLWVWINAVRLLVQSDSNEARVRITDGTSATTPYRLVNYDSDGNYLSFNPCLNWYWAKSHTAGTTVTITPQIRSVNGSSNIVWGDNGDTSMMIIQEIAR